MTQIMTLTEYLLYECNLMARERGDDIEVVFEHPGHPKPRLAARDGDVVQFPERPTEKGTANGRD
jgi:hypothetical protein